MIFLILFPVITTHAHDNGSIWGKITDMSMNPVMNAKVFIKDTMQKKGKTLFSNMNGDFKITGLSPGIYEIQVEAEGFKPVYRDNIFLEPSQTLNISILLATQNQAELSSSKLIFLDHTQCISLRSTSLQMERVFDN